MKILSRERVKSRSSNFGWQKFVLIDYKLWYFLYGIFYINM